MANDKARGDVALMMRPMKTGIIASPKVEPNTNSVVEVESLASKL